VLKIPSQKLFSSRMIKGSLDDERYFSLELQILKILVVKFSALISFPQKYLEKKKIIG
jgi:hypothetical protein